MNTAFLHHCLHGLTAFQVPHGTPMSTIELVARETRDRITLKLAAIATIQTYRAAQAFAEGDAVRGRCYHFSACTLADECLELAQGKACDPEQQAAISLFIQNVCMPQGGGATMEQALEVFMPSKGDA
jgi:hypothetical protein